MIVFLEGTLVEKQPARIVLDVGGVGYEVTIPLSSYEKLPDENAKCRVLIHDHIREDSHDLFGFFTDGERRMFTLLLGISGVGPKTAIAALSGLSVRDITAAIAQGDVKRLSSISGIGKKTAERIVVELKDKLSAGESMAALSGSGEAVPEEQGIHDAVLALISLGYKQADAIKMARTAVEKLGDKPKTEAILRFALAR